MNIYFVIGPTQSGKTTFRKHKFPELPFVDLWDHQSDLVGEFTVKMILNSYAKCRRAAIALARTGQDFVLEHTLLRAIRRVYYIKKLAAYGRLICYYTTNGGVYGDDALQVYELPLTSEGFAEVHPIPAKQEQQHDI